MTFPHLGNLTVHPEMGRALLWPSVLDRDPNTRDDRTLHEVLGVETGEMYGAKAWIHQRDYRETLKQYCNIESSQLSSS